MSDINELTNTDLWQVTVGNHRDLLTEKMEAGHLRGHYDDPRIWRHNTPARVLWSAKYSVAGWVGFLLGVAIVIVPGLAWAWRQGPDHDFAGLVIFLTGLAGFGVWGAACVHAEVTMDRYSLRPRDAQAGLVGEIAASKRRLVECRDREVPGAATALEAIEELRPVLEALVDESNRLAAARSRARDGYATYAYAEELAAVITQMNDTMLDITAEVNAATAIVFARRNDLLVTMAAEAAAVVKVDPVRLTKAQEDVLASAREKLAAVTMAD